LLIGLPGSACRFWVIRSRQGRVIAVASVIVPADGLLGCQMDVVGTAAGHPAVRGLVDDFLIDEGLGKRLQRV